MRTTAVLMVFRKKLKTKIALIKKNAKLSHLMRISCHILHNCSMQMSINDQISINIPIGIIDTSTQA